MLQPCRLYWNVPIHLRNRIFQFPSFHSWDGSRNSSKRTTGGLAVTHKIDNEDTNHSLDCVPPIRNTLFEPAQPRPRWYKSLNTRADALKMCNQRWLAPYQHSKPWPVDNTAAFNELVSRMRKLGVDMPPEKILFGIQLAVNEPTAMKQYLQILLRFFGEGSHMKDYTMGTMRYLWTRVCDSADPECLEQLSKRKAIQFLEVITGWQDGHAQQLGEERQPSIYHLMLACDNSSNSSYVWDSPWSLYLDLVSTFGGKSEVYTEWLDLKGRSSVSSVSKSLNVARNAVIRALVRQGDPERAWEVTYETNDPVKDIEYKTWQLLLKHQEGMKQWSPEMNEPAITMLSNELQGLERRLGIAWKGGEDGYHVVEREPFWVRENEGLTGSE